MTRLRLDWLLVLAVGSFGLAQPACGGEASGSGGSGGNGGSPAASSSSSSGVGGMPANSSSSTGGSVPIECPSGTNTTVPMGECDLLQQNCPPGFGCEPVNVGGGEWASNCVPGNGLKGPAANCANSGECKPGLECVFGKCVPPCCPDNDDPCENGLCNVINDQDYGPYEVYFCSFLTTCNLFDPTACDNGAEGNCYPTPNGYSFCAPPGPNVGMEGETCDTLNSCQSNMFCTNSICRWACLLDMSSTVPGEGGCPMGQNCLDLGLGIPGTGICQPG